MALTFDREGKLQVRVPHYVSERAVKAFVEQHKKWIDAHKDAARQRAQTQYTPAQILEMKRKTEEMVRPYLAKYSAAMGVHPAKISITAARTRFGSCNTKGNVCFSFLLCLYPPDAVEYVVVHELAHLRHPNHSADFHALVQKYLPDEKRRVALLRNGSRQST